MIFSFEKSIQKSQQRRLLHHGFSRQTVKARQGLEGKVVGAGIKRRKVAKDLPARSPFREPFGRQHHQNQVGIDGRMSGFVPVKSIKISF